MQCLIVTPMSFAYEVVATELSGAQTVPDSDTTMEPEDRALDGWREHLPHCACVCVCVHACVRRAHIQSERTRERERALISA